MRLDSGSFRVRCRGDGGELFLANLSFLPRLWFSKQYRGESCNTLHIDNRPRRRYRSQALANCEAGAAPRDHAPPFFIPDFATHLETSDTPSY